jgi:hypothetical protein
MHRLCVRSACLAACLGMAASARADEAATVTLSPEAPATLTCEEYSQVSCTGTNAQVIADVADLATETRNDLARIIPLGPTWRYPVHITLLDPVAGQKPPREGVAALTDGTGLRVEAVLPSNDPQAREFIQRQFVNAILWEEYFKPDATFTAQTRLDVVPLWLVEGLREYLNDDPDRNREEIVKRAALGNRAPTLAEVTAWKDLSSDRLLGLWQRAFCYYLVDSLVYKEPRRADFRQWLASITGPNPSSAVRLFPTEMGWQRELREASARSRDIVYSWDQSAAELTAAETIAIPKEMKSEKVPDQTTTTDQPPAPDKTAPAAKSVDMVEDPDTRLCTIETVGTFPRSLAMDRAISKKVLELTALQLRVHPSWQPIVELYRFGLTALVRDNDPKRAADYLHQAHVRRAAEMEFHDKLVDYANWYEVTQNLPSTGTHFRSYFDAAQELDKAEGDPQHPNPIRADLLKVESEF